MKKLSDMTMEELTSSKRYLEFEVTNVDESDDIRETAKKRLEEVNNEIAKRTLMEG